MMNKIIGTILCVVVLSGCAASRGFLAGTFGGPQYVDENIYGQAVPGSAHTELKVSAYQTLMVVTAWSIWPVAVTAAGLSGIYGAYQFWKWKGEHGIDYLLNHQHDAIPAGATK